jgi:hypothetical protein
MLNSHDISYTHSLCVVNGMKNEWKLRKEEEDFLSINHKLHITAEKKYEIFPRIKGKKRDFCIYF